MGLRRDIPYVIEGNFGLSHEAVIDYIAAHFSFDFIEISDAGLRCISERLFEQETERRLRRVPFSVVAEYIGDRALLISLSRRERPTGDHPEGVPYLVPFAQAGVRRAQQYARLYSRKFSEHTVNIAEVCIQKALELKL